MGGLGRNDGTDRRPGPTIAGTKNDIHQTLDQFAKGLFPVTNEERDQIVKQIARSSCGLGRCRTNRKNSSFEDQHTYHA